MAEIALSAAATGMQAQQARTAMIADKLANLNTPGYRERFMVLADNGYINIRRAGTASSEAGTIVPQGVQLGLGVKPVAVAKTNNQGPPVSTGDPYHIMIRGEGFFQIDMPDGSIAYTRAGTFGASADGTIVTPDGFPLSGGLVVPAGTSSITINAEGQVSAEVPPAVDPVVVGNIQLANFRNPSGLDGIGDNLLRETAASGEATIGAPTSSNFGSLLQGFLEGSSVNAVSAITELIESQRSYEMGANVIRTVGEMMKASANMG